MRYISMIAYLVAALALVAGTRHAVAAGNNGACKGTVHLQADPGGGYTTLGHYCFGDCPEPLPVGAECDLVFFPATSGTQKAICGCTKGTSWQIDSKQVGSPWMGGTGGLQTEPLCDVISTWDITQNPPVITGDGCDGTCDGTGGGPCQSDVTFDEGGQVLYSCHCP